MHFLSALYPGYVAIAVCAVCSLACVVMSGRHGCLRVLWMDFGMSHITDKPTSSGIYFYMRGGGSGGGGVGVTWCVCRLGEQLGYTSTEDWYKLKEAQIREKGGYTLLQKARNRTAHTTQFQHLVLSMVPLTCSWQVFSLNIHGI